MSGAKGMFLCCVSSLIQVVYHFYLHCAILIHAFKAGIDEQGLHVKNVFVGIEAMFFGRGPLLLV